MFAMAGVLHHPNVPEFGGIEEFGGAVFHSARWDHSVPLEGKKIAVIGTGSTAVQITSAPRRQCERVRALSTQCPVGVAGTKPRVLR